MIPLAKLEIESVWVERVSPGLGSEWNRLLQQLIVQSSLYDIESHAILNN
jgi:hypothetical protein